MRNANPGLGGATADRKSAPVLQNGRPGIRMAQGSIEGTPTICSPRFISGRWAVKDRGEKGDSQMQDFYSRLQPAGGGEESCQRLLRMWWW